MILGKVYFEKRPKKGVANIVNYLVGSKRVRSKIGLSEGEHVIILSVVGTRVKLKSLDYDGSRPIWVIDKMKEIMTGLGKIKSEAIFGKNDII